MHIFLHPCIYFSIYGCSEQYWQRLLCESLGMRRLCHHSFHIGKDGCFLSSLARPPHVIQLRNAERKPSQVRQDPQPFLSTTHDMAAAKNGISCVRFFFWGGKLISKNSPPFQGCCSLICSNSDKSKTTSATTFIITSTFRIAEIMQNHYIQRCHSYVSE